jgi:hypothetical protein
LLRRVCVCLVLTGICGCERVLGLKGEDDTANTSAAAIDATCAMPDSSIGDPPGACDGAASCALRDADVTESTPAAADTAPPDADSDVVDVDVDVDTDADAVTDATGSAQGDVTVHDAADAADVPESEAAVDPCTPPAPTPPTIRGGLPMPLAYWALDGSDFVPPHVMRARIGGFDGLVALDEGQIGVAGQIGGGYGVSSMAPVREAIVVPPRAVDPLDLTQAGTWSAWVLLSALPSDLAVPETVIDKGGFDTDLALEALLDPTTTNNNFAFFFGDTSVSSSVSLQTDVWYHVVATFQAQGQLCIYVAGTTKDCAPAGTRIHDVQPLKLGEGAYFTSRGLAGTLDEVAIWDVALSDAQVETLHQLGAQGLPIVGN